jgi:hypothetical protein
MLGSAIVRSWQSKVIGRYSRYPVGAVLIRVAMRCFGVQTHPPHLRARLAGPFTVGHRDGVLSASNTECTASHLTTCGHAVQ